MPLTSVPRVLYTRMNDECVVVPASGPCYCSWFFDIDRGPSTGAAGGTVKKPVTQLLTILRLSSSFRSRSPTAPALDRDVLNKFGFANI